MTQSTATMGVMIPRDVPADEFLELVRHAESLGFAAAWVPEDLGYRGGFAQAAAALASTRSIRIGIGIVPAGARAAAFAAMEAATLAELFPGRVDVGVGHGMPGWMKSVDRWPRSPLTLLEETIACIRALVRGEQFPAGRYVRADGLRLDSVPEVAPDLLLGVRRPRSLRLSGRIAEGTVLSEPASPEYVARAVAQIAAERPHRVVVYNLAAVRDDPADAVDHLRGSLTSLGHPDTVVHLDGLEFADDLLELRSRTPEPAEYVASLPPEWVSRLTLAGTAAHVRDRLAAFEDAGATEHVLVPVGPDFRGELDRFAAVLR